MNHTKIIDLHKKLARRIKEYETTQELFPPSEVLNEMRYALRAVMEIIELESSPSPSSSDEDMNLAIQKANHAFLCAYHDLVDGLTVDVSVIMEDLRKKYLEESILVLGAKRIEIIEFINKVNDAIVASREDPSQRRKVYEEVLYDEYFETLLKYRKLLTGRMLGDVITLYRKKRKRRAITIGVSATVATTVAIIGIIVKLYVR